jgi:hypothetical protein
MATTTRSGAIYGIGVYAVSRYGKSNVTYVPDGVEGTATLNSNVVIIGKANHVVVSLVATGAVGSVGVVGVAVTSVVGVSATGSVNSAVSFKIKPDSMNQIR